MILKNKFLSPLVALVLCLTPVNADNSSECPSVIGTDLQRALESCLGSAEQGDVRAQLLLGVIYSGFSLNGERLPPNYTEAVRWYRAAADEGNAFAQFRLGEMYMNGLGVEYDPALSFHWYYLAAEQGEVRAQAQLGFLYSTGIGVSQSLTEAVRWYSAAANQGSSLAQFSLGRMYQTGSGVPQNYSAALRLYLAAAVQGNPAAQTNLGVMYSEGQGVLQDYVSAHMWYNLASANSIGETHEIAVRNRNTLSEKMTSEQIAEAQSRAQICIESDYDDCGI